MKKSLFPQAFGPGSWRGLPPELIRLYSTVLSGTDTESKKLEHETEETPPPSEKPEPVKA